MNHVLKLLTLACLLVTPTMAVAEGHNHSHNHFSPALERLGDDIIGLTVCYRNGYLSDEDQEPAFTNLINQANATGEELGMFYMDKLGPKAETIMGDDNARALWSQDFCSDLTTTYLDADELAKSKNHQHDHTHAHEHHNHDHADLSADIVQQDIERGRLLSIN
ncbi:hypothetical protein ACE1OE_15755 [Vibrio sp. E150_011]|uniref:hypothetical protein n=1 Tax=Vibrio sp. 10N.261.51.F12 TaxID=3229679 RepID=UPI003553EBD8